MPNPLQLRDLDETRVYEQVNEEMRLKLRRIAAVYACYRDTLSAFKEDIITVSDPDTGFQSNFEVGDPEYAYRLLAIMDSLVGVLGPLLTLDS